MIGIDTNILVYAFDNAYPEKNKICRKIIRDIFNGEKKGAVTNQILAEFSFVVSKKIEKPISNREIKDIIEAIKYSGNWDIINYSTDEILSALNSDKPFWDSIIIATFEKHKVKEIITENIKDFNNSDLKVINPF